MKSIFSIFVISLFSICIFAQEKNINNDELDETLITIDGKTYKGSIFQMLNDSVVIKGKSKQEKIGINNVIKYKINNKPDIFQSAISGALIGALAGIVVDGASNILKDFEVKVTYYGIIIGGIIGSIAALSASVEEYNLDNMTNAEKIKLIRKARN